jgi:hypothetical protein
VETRSARRVFLDGLVDDAGLFPPARLSMADALDARVRARAGLAPWIVGRFVVPASRLGELRIELEGRAERLAASVIVDGTESISLALANLAQAARSAAHVVVLASVECPLARIGSTSDEARIAAFAAALEGAAFAATPGVYLEIPLARTQMERAVAALATARTRGFEAFAKIRCGGLEASAIPAAERIAAFLRSASDAALPFKATAGLHHALPRYDVELGATTHGFLNLAGAAAFALLRGFDRETLAAMLSDRDVTHFTLDEDAFRWHGHSAAAAEIARVRASFVHSYGSCSLTEPADDLRDLGLLERTPA